MGEDYTVSAELVLNEADAADVADETKTAFNGILDGKTIGQYYDISVQADVLKDGEVVKGLENIPVTDMKDKISISLKIPENLLNDGRTYSMLRYHNGQASVLDTTESEGTVTFSTDGFSTYALAYADAQGQGTLTGKPTVDKNNKDIQKTDKVTSSGTDVTVKKTSASAEKAPKTGDQTELLLTFAAVAAGMILTASVYGLRRKMK
ncbi:LPXTG cell wall anchor domain-containing protein [Mediterraneibacter glycyrrhizinilyticus]|uniref:LPXTG cell wall anchor domain-containing protein n=1 Tax=Mediterraneibacter glycyrrhizinilyticus TaxID=342942 RepID=UPI0019618064|nr:LPXTG cell wall anchor domain-containing protein [Mediterraneibacter glycyrrhizinilyticus]MBM6752781.1 LPXTG cell wall anchor domain-containing protein [Mediterraneibacter glycyrrhizinilyticus]